MDWSHDMAKAPRGKYRVVPAGPTAKAARKVFERAEIVVAGACGVVTRSYFIPEELRWSMFTADAGPIAWMPLEGIVVEIVDGAPRKIMPAHPTMAESWFERALRERRAA